MVYVMIGIGALVAMRFVHLVRYVPMATPFILIALHTWKRTTMTALGIWIAAAIVAALLWRNDRG